MLMIMVKQGYIVVDDDDNLIYDDVNEHEYLFNFLDEDLSTAANLFEESFYAILNHYHPDQDDYPDISDHMYLLEEGLKEIHPFLQYSYDDFLFNSIGDFLNANLIHQLNGNGSHTFSSLLDEFLYNDLFKKLYPNSYDKFDEKVSKFYKSYYYNALDEPDIDASYIPLPPQGLYDLIDLQNQLRKMVFWILNPSIDHLNELSTDERIVAYNIICGKQFGSNPVSFSKTFSFSNTNQVQNDNRYESLIDLHNHPDSIGAEEIEELRNVVEQVKNTNVKGLVETYEVKVLADVLFYQVYHMVLYEEKVKKCRNCGKHFIVRHLNVEYCNRKVKSLKSTEKNSTCFDIGSKLAYQKKLKEDLPLQYYNRSYKTHYARRKNSKMSQSDFYEWQQEAKAKLDAVRLGEYDFEAYKVWLKK